MESYNRQLLRQTNLYSKVVGDVVRAAEIQLQLLGEAPKDFTLVDVIRFTWQLSSRLDTTATAISKISADNFNKVNVLEESLKQSGVAKTEGNLIKGERFSSEERKIHESVDRVLTTVKSLARSIETDKLTTMIKESSGIRDRNLELMIKSGEEKSEIYLERHIKEQLKARH